MRCTFQSKRLILYTPLRSVWGHATIMSVLLWWAYRLDCLHFFLALAIAALLWVGRQGGFSFILFPYVTVNIGFCPSGCFRRCHPFVYLFKDFYELEHCTSFPLGIYLKILSLKVGLICPCIRNCIEDNLIDIFHLHFIGGVRAWKERQEVFQFCQPCRKTLEGHALRFMHCAHNCVLLLGEQIDWEEILLVKPPEYD